MQIGDRATMKKTFLFEDIELFSKLSLDRNPLHLDLEYAKKTRFKERIVHGFLAGSLISAVIGEKLPGPGSIYLSQTLNFRHPVYIGEEITAEVVIKDIKKGKIFFLETKCINSYEQIVIDGEAVVLYENRHELPNKG